MHKNKILKYTVIEVCFSKCIRFLEQNLLTVNLRSSTHFLFAVTSLLAHSVRSLEHSVTPCRATLAASRLAASTPAA